MRAWRSSATGPTGFPAGDYSDSDTFDKDQSIPKLNLGNVNISVEAPEDAQVVTGQAIISREYFQGR